MWRWQLHIHTAGHFSEWTAGLSARTALYYYHPCCHLTLFSVILENYPHWESQVPQSSDFFCGLACSIYRGWKEVSALRLLLCLSESIVLNLTFKRGIGDLVTSLFVRACPCAIHAPINRWLYSVCRLLKEAGGWGWGRLQVHVCVLVCVFARIRKWTAGPEGAVCLSLCVAHGND